MPLSPARRPGCAAELAPVSLDSLGDLGSFCTGDEATAAERAYIRLHGINDPRDQQRRDLARQAGRPRSRVTLDRTEWSTQQDQQEVRA